uniref:N/A n=1 Tax=Ganoderma boninense TaxID=34458 RepID=A0A5K1JUS0_9APHY|nr:N/A [Ganoderma boninense]
MLINHGEATAGQIVNVMFTILMRSFSLAFLAPWIQASSQTRGAAAKLNETVDRVPSIALSSPDNLKPEK